MKLVICQTPARIRHFNKVLPYQYYMAQILLWLYIINSVLLINHEIDSAYWKEWNLFRIPGGITFFLLTHFLIIFIILLGIMLLLQNKVYGLIISLLVALGGIFAFSIHVYFISKGHKEFKTFVSIFILSSTLIVSIFQLIFTVLSF